MPDLNGLFTDDRDEAPSNLPASGQIKRAPATLDDDVWVLIPSFDEEIMVGPCAWQPRGDLLPQVDDRCLVVFDENDEPWVVLWQPQT